jgi:hypothetical protein
MFPLIVICGFIDPIDRTIACGRLRCQRAEGRSNIHDVVRMVVESLKEQGEAKLIG